jgi:hypothetical protein
VAAGGGRGRGRAGGAVGEVRGAAAGAGLHTAAAALQPWPQSDRSRAAGCGSCCRLCPPRPGLLTPMNMYVSMNCSWLLPWKVSLSAMPSACARAGGGGASAGGGGARRRPPLQLPRQAGWAGPRHRAARARPPGAAAEQPQPPRASKRRQCRCAARAAAHLAAHDGQRAGQRADGEVDEDVGGAVLGRHVIDQEDDDCDGEQAVEYKGCGGGEGREGGRGGERTSSERRGVRGVAAACSLAP